MFRLFLKGGNKMFEIPELRPMDMPSFSTLSLMAALKVYKDEQNQATFMILMEALITSYNEMIENAQYCASQPEITEDVLDSMIASINSMTKSIIEFEAQGKEKGFLPKDFGGLTAATQQ